MAVTTPATVDTSIPELWAKSVLRDQLRKGFFANKIGGEGSRMPVIRKTELLNNAGDTIHITVTNPLVAAGVSGDTTPLAGTEEAITTSNIKCVPLLYRHAVRLNRRARKKSILNLREEAAMRLAEWGGEKMDDVRFGNFVQSTPINGDTYTPFFRTVGNVGPGGVPGDVAAADKLDVNTIMLAKLDLYNRRALPLIDAQGREFFMAVVHPNSLYDLKRSTEYGNWVREAHVRGADNPLFRGATAMIDGVLIFEHNNVITANDGAAAIAVSRNLVFGAEAYLEGVDEETHWSEDSFDYELEAGVGYEFAFQPRRGLEKNSLILLAAAVTP